jgi:spore coat polysaccharide biosynthesis protein SpsF
MTASTMIILQARMSSSRLPGKVLKEINGKPMIYWQIQRIMQAEEFENLIVATSTDPSDDVLHDYLKEQNIQVSRGSLRNVYKRFADILEKSPKDQVVVRLTGDCPLVMPDLIDYAVKLFKKSNLDYLSNTIRPTYPDGLDVEIFSSQAFLRLNELHLNESEEEHVTLAFHRESLKSKSGNFSHENDLSGLRWTVDYQEDFDFVTRIYSNFQGMETQFKLQNILDLLEVEPWLKPTLRGNLRNQALPTIKIEGSDASL